MVGCKTKEETGHVLESLIVGNGNHGEELRTLPTVQRGNKEYVVVVTDGRPELQATATYLQENLSGLVRQPRNGLELIVLQVPNVDFALQTYYEHPLDVALIIAEKRGPEASGSRIKYVISDFDHLVWTGVVDPFTVRDVEMPESVGKRVTEIDEQQLAKTIALELKEMRNLFRKSVYRLSVEERRQLESERRRRIDRILLEEGDYIIHGKGLQKDAVNVAELDASAELMNVMRPLVGKEVDIDTATTRWQRAKKGFSSMDLYGVVTFGVDQSLGGGYVLGDLTKLSRLGKPVFGFKRTPSLEDAAAFKAAIDFHINLAEENSGIAETSKGRLNQIWHMAKLNVPRVIGVLPDEKGGVVFMEYRGLTIYPIGILQPGYPNILEELIAHAQQKDELGNLASQLLDATFVTAAKKLGFWRANPYTKLPAAEPAEERQRYYASRETLLLMQASILGLKLDESQLTNAASFFDYVNSQLKLHPEDTALRIDMRIEHLGFDIGDKLLPTGKDVIEATRDGGSISHPTVDESLVIYDAGGKKILVPLHHELSHLKEHPLLKWSLAEAQRYTAIALASQQMFTAVKRRNGSFKWYETLNWAITTPPESFDLQEAAKHIPQLAGFGVNEAIIDFYRDLEEARQILTTRLPRLYIRQERLHPESEQAMLLERTITTRIGHFNYYVKRALDNLAIWQEGHTLPTDQKSNYALVRESLEKLVGVRDMQRGNIVTLWDGL